MQDSKKGKKIVREKQDAYGDSPFQEIIKLYGQEEYICDNSDILFERLCEKVGAESIDDLSDPDLVSRIQHISCSIPDDWKWAEIEIGEGTICRLGLIIQGMADIDFVADPDTAISDYEFSNGYMIRIG